MTWNLWEKFETIFDQQTNQSTICWLQYTPPSYFISNHWGVMSSPVKRILAMNSLSSKKYIGIPFFQWGYLFIYGFYCYHKQGNITKTNQGEYLNSNRICLVSGNKLYEENIGYWKIKKNNWMSVYQLSKCQIDITTNVFYLNRRM